MGLLPTVWNTVQLCATVTVKEWEHPISKRGTSKWVFNPQWECYWMILSFSILCVDSHSPVVFVFVPQSGYHLHVLVHSTHRLRLREGAHVLGALLVCPLSRLTQSLWHNRHPLWHHLGASLLRNSVSTHLVQWTVTCLYQIFIANGRRPFFNSR